MPAGGAAGGGRLSRRTLTFVSGHETNSPFELRILWIILHRCTEIAETPYTGQEIQPERNDKRLSRRQDHRRNRILLSGPGTPTVDVWPQRFRFVIGLNQAVNRQILVRYVFHERRMEQQAANIDPAHGFATDITAIEKSHQNEKIVRNSAFSYVLDKPGVARQPARKILRIFRKAFQVGRIDHSPKTHAIQTYLVAIGI